MTPSGPAVWLAAVAALALALGYVMWALPRLPPKPALAITGLAVLLGAGVALAWPESGAFAALPVTAVIFGHLGHAVRRQQPGTAAQASVPVAPSPAVAPETPVPSSTTPASTTVPTTVAATPVVAAGLPSTLGRYRIDSEIGRGSMGAVYLGHDPQIGRQVAIKALALSREFQGDKLAEARRRFFREAETAGRLQHPDIVTIFDAGEAQDLAYIAMEYIQGADLQRHAAPDRLLPVGQVLEVGARVAQALAHAHRQGVVHRDIKPANVMVNLDKGLVKVTDFGIARITDAARTRTGLVLGTPSYMSPEQMAGRRIDGRTDLYSLGVMLFQLLTGRLPHQGESMARLMYQITNDPAPDLRSLRPELPQALADILALALQKRAEVRYGDGGQMAADLRAVAGQAMLPESADFEKTVTFTRQDPRHNSAT